MPVDHYTLLHGDCLELLRALPDSSVDAVVTDPPYGLAFMGKRWDYDVPSVDIWAECLRVLKPGGHLLAFAGTRTQHRMAVRIEDSGFEIRDMIAWVYGSGFPKSLDVSKAIDKAAGAEREVVGANPTYRRIQEQAANYNLQRNPNITAPATEAAKQWQGWGTALKPALEPITVARKPLSGTVAETVLEHGTGAINVDGCRVSTNESLSRSRNGVNNLFSGLGSQDGSNNPEGRWPANLIHDGSDEVTGLFPVTGASKAAPRNNQIKDEFFTGKKPTITYGHDDDGGSAARFFYCAKASKADRDEGCELFDEVRRTDGRTTEHHVPNLRTTARKNHHPTVKPTDLMRYLCRLVTPPGGVVLDPFMGSGSTGKAAILEGFRFIGCEREADYVEIARARITTAANERAQELPLATS